ncbi:polynucleotide kinase 3 phosphatase-domain-containing protein [Roridomyces roridus]|uniref:Polynucleotide kinase 3 phosphatase-domain-containing protein n=1 Tax=Roridomyces roridus TaxID=1738132 RepID=A0AAD7FA64_9AGAR|nr:polynucleotide kinase 3 phosphatase-domain-containing protein [Roridomyces roridus]
MPSPSASKKRTASESKLDSDCSSPNKVAKEGSKPETETTLTWLKPIAGSWGCLHGVNNNPQSYTKVAVFDLDGTLIEFLPFKEQKAYPLRWYWWNRVVLDKLAQTVNEGYAVVLVSNQSWLTNDVMLRNWKDKIALIAAAVPDLPFRIFAACGTGNFKYRKPNVGFWEELEKVFAQDGVIIDKTRSFFAGDAAGREKDFSSSDRKFALNVGLPFQTPEEYFLGKKPNPNFKLSGLDISTLPQGPLFTPSSSPLVPNPPRKEIVLFVGYPSLGKTTFFRQHFAPAGYQHVNQDTLGSRDRCIKRVREELSEGSGLCVVDNTNRDVSTRRFYIDLAKKFKVPIRCFWFTGSIQLAWHNNMYRACALPSSVAERESPREVVPKVAYTGYKKQFEEPQRDEGFTEIKKINWIFDGTEEERKAWAKWFVLIDSDKAER